MSGARPGAGVVHALLLPADALPGDDRGHVLGGHAVEVHHVHSFTRGLDLDIQAVTAALTLPHHNGRAEGTSTKTR